MSTTSPLTSTDPRWYASVLNEADGLKKEAILYLGISVASLVCILLGILTATATMAMRPGILTIMSGAVLASPGGLILIAYCNPRGIIIIALAAILLAVGYLTYHNRVHLSIGTSIGLGAFVTLVSALFSYIGYREYKKKLSELWRKEP